MWTCSPNASPRSRRRWASSRSPPAHTAAAPGTTTGGYSCVLRSYRLPQAISYQSLHDRLREQDIVIYGGQGDLGGDIFRVACMGEISDEDMNRLLRALKDCLGRTRP